MSHDMLRNVVFLSGQTRIMKCVHIVGIIDHHEKKYIRKRYEKETYLKLDVYPYHSHSENHH